MPKCIIIRNNAHVSHHVGNEGSGCFYFPFQSLNTLALSSCLDGWSFGVHPARIEVKDTRVSLHKHAGMTIALVTAGSGIFIDETGEHEVHTGDWIIVPPFTPHLSIANLGTVMIEHVVYLGASDDIQTSLPT